MCEAIASSTLHLSSGLECPQLFQWMDWERQPEAEKNLIFYVNFFGEESEDEDEERTVTANVRS